MVTNTLIKYYYVKSDIMAWGNLCHNIKFIDKRETTSKLKKENKRIIFSYDDTR